MRLNIVLLEPEIPQNTGNIARTCVITNTKLHLIKPMKFSIEEKEVKRAGMDYWKELDLEVHENYQDFMKKYQAKKIFYATTKARKTHSDIDYTSYDEDIFIMFGKESKGIPESILKENEKWNIRVPMGKKEIARSLNLSNSVSIIIYEVLRQWDYPGLL